ncbi:uncharacterized protein LOC111694592 [Trichogramma pretiosum]|uniref:uncharacterized protein LOC111694592 n=1 Tax=Trichogramma pretiosum TaxID=7493 RepID=UPI000C719DA1|nr:uncharacterized protein LOC111694592 [Trichogramma pretiosum]
MEGSSRFAILGLLFIACTIGEVLSVDYTGDTHVRVKQHWEITCSKVKDLSSIWWKRNGMVLGVEEFSTGMINVKSPVQNVTDKTWSSTLIAQEATEVHEGAYTCSDEGNETHHLTLINVDYTGDTPVRVKQHWEITCSKVKDLSSIWWKRNGMSLGSEEYSTGKINVKSPVQNVTDKTWSSTLIVQEATEVHEGAYTCSDEGNVTHHLTLINDDPVQKNLTLGQ